MGLLKDSVKSKLPFSYKEYRARKDAAAQSAATPEKQESKPKERKAQKPLPDYAGEDGYPFILILQKNSADVWDSEATNGGGLHGVCCE